MNATSTPLLVDMFELPTTLSALGVNQSDTGIDLAKCENCVASPKAMQALAHIEARYLSDHWDAQDVVLRTKLATLHDVHVEQVFLVRGGMGGIRYAFEILTHPGTRVGLIRPDFPFWWDAQRARTEVCWLEAGPFPFAHSVPEITRFIRDQRPEFVIFSNPNAATGTKMTADTIEAVLKESPETFFAIDEADTIETGSAAPLTTQYQNTLIIRSFSKFYGLSGLRIGYVVVPPSLIEHFRRFVDFLEVTSFGIVAATAVLDDLEFQRQTQDRVRASLAKIQAACAGTSYVLVPGSSCFACYLWADHSVEDPLVTLGRHGIKLAKSKIFGLDRGGRINLSEPGLIDAAADIIARVAAR